MACQPGLRSQVQALLPLIQMRQQRRELRRQRLRYVHINGHTTSWPPIPLTAYLISRQILRGPNRMMFGVVCLLLDGARPAGGWRGAAQALGGRGQPVGADRAVAAQARAPVSAPGPQAAG